MQQPQVPSAPGALPFVGHVHQFRHALRYLTSLPSHGDLVELRIGPGRVLMVCSAALAHEVLRSGQVFDKGGQFFERAKEVVGNSLTTCTHEEHRRQRRLMQPAFSRNRIAGYTLRMNEQIAAMSGRWRDDTTVDVAAETSVLAASMLASTVFRRHAVSPEELAQVLRDVDTLVAVAAKRMVLPAALNKLPTPDNRRYQAANARLRALMTRAAASWEASDPPDLLSMLLAATGGDSLTTAGAVDQLVLFQIAGIDTTASALAWALWLIATHPEAEAKLHAEVDVVLDGAETATHEQLAALPYTRQVVDETLRLYPPVWILTRTAMAAAGLGGYSVAAGATLAISPYLLHRSRDNYPDPERFAPDRWASPGAGTAAFVPFGYGARRCIGEHFAQAELVLALAALAARWRCRPAAALLKRPPAPRLTASLRPPPLPMLLSRRSI